MRENQHKSTIKDSGSQAINAFFNIAEKWKLENEDMKILLGQPTKSTFHNWKNGKVRTVSFDTIERVSYVLGIYKALRYLYDRQSMADAWVKKENKAFNGLSALDVMKSGSITDLARVRAYLDSVRG